MTYIYMAPYYYWYDECMCVNLPPENNFNEETDDEFDFCEALFSDKPISWIRLPNKDKNQKWC